jgi:hypothetical protein
MSLAFDPLTEESQYGSALGGQGVHGCTFVHPAVALGETQSVR